jgi:hypothetical protein
MSSQNLLAHELANFVIKMLCKGLVHGRVLAHVSELCTTDCMNLVLSNIQRLSKKNTNNASLCPPVALGFCCVRLAYSILQNNI